LKLIITEKPSVSAAIAHAIGAHEPFGNSYNIRCYRNDEYIVANALGHLYNIGEPQDYGFAKEKWDSTELPMKPYEFGIFPTLACQTLEYAKTLEKQRNLLRDLLASNLVTEIICATDAGREGELIFRYIYSADKCEKPVKRLWISSLTEQAILQGMANLKPDSDYDNLFLSGKTRSMCDWLFGFNFSRLYSIFDNTTHRVRRVKTPVLAMIVNRDKAIKAHVKRVYYQIVLSNGAMCATEFDSKDEAEKLANSLRGQTFNVIKADKKAKTENRPKLFSLTTLQQAANKKFDGMTASVTLKAAQTLYEKKLLTYPRTASENLSEDMREQFSTVVNAISAFEPERVNDVISHGLNLDSRIFDNAGITDHHAIIPTEQVGKAIEMKLSTEEKKVLSLVIERVLLSVCGVYSFEETEYIFDCNGTDFSITSEKPVEPGWRKYAPKATTRCEDYAYGEAFVPDGIAVKECEKLPPKHFTDDTLLSAMQNIDNVIEDKSLAAFAKSLENKGLGTPATRAAMIEELIAAGYIERRGKSIYATAFGAEFSDSLPESLKSAVRTTEWEQILAQIESVPDTNAAASLSQNLLNSIADFVTSTVNQEKNVVRKPLANKNPIAPERASRESLGICPRCGRQIFEGKLAFYCESGKMEDGGCGFTLWKEDKFFKDTLTSEKVTELLKGEAIERKPIAKDGKIYTARFRISADEKDKSGEKFVRLERITPAKKALGNCPKCGKQIFEGVNNYYCESATREHPCFTLWKTSKFLSFEVTPKMVAELLKNGKVEVGYKDELSGAKIRQNYTLTEGKKPGSWFLRCES
jgi:DNA topoisomerase-3